jgi:hypothetical protein
LNYVYISSSVKYIGSYAFASGLRLEEIVYGGTMDEWSKLPQWFIADSGVTIVCTDGTVYIG